MERRTDNLIIVLSMADCQVLMAGRNYAAVTGSILGCHIYRRKNRENYSAFVRDASA